MDLFELIAALLTLAALFSYVNARWLHLPMAIGLMVIALAFSAALILLGTAIPWIRDSAEAIVAGVDFNKTLMHGMLGFLLFAGALHVDLADLKEHRWIVGLLASFGVGISTLLVALLAWFVFGLCGIEVRFIYCLLFGALISPTDPIAVLSILKQAKAPKPLEVKITGESLFNDGMGVVIFLGLYEIATGQHGFDLPHLLELFLTEVVGGALFGAAIGYAAFRMLQTVDNASAEILLTLAVAAGGYAFAHAMHLSGPIAMVVAGLLIGNQGRAKAMSEMTKERLDTFWELIDEILNAVLFVLIGLEILILTFTSQYLFAGLLLIPAVLAARYLSVLGPILLVSRLREIHPHAARILTWGGLRGGISVALALSIPAIHVDGSPIHERDPLLAVTYLIVIFSITVQGLTIGRLVKFSVKETDPSQGAQVESKSGSGNGASPEVP